MWEVVVDLDQGRKEVDVVDLDQGQMMTLAPQSLQFVLGTQHCLTMQLRLSNSNPNTCG